MVTPLLSTKLFLPPPRPDLIPRPRLIERLNTGLQGKLTLISAPAGFGKTTLLSHWIAGRDEPVAWLSLDSGDNDPNRFLSYIVAALQILDDNIGKGVLAVLQSPGMANTESAQTMLLNELAEFPENFILVLDDYHAIESQQVDNTLGFMIDNLPQQSHFIIASRIDPSVSLSRLRVGGQLMEVRAEDLRFTSEEAAAFLTQVMGVDLSFQDVAALVERTEGWIAGLQLAAFSMQGLKGKDEVTDFIRRFASSDRYIHDYLTDEVLQQRPAGTKQFLLQTSILNRLNGSLCDTVTNRSDSQAILESLDVANLFIMPLDSERRWYRYHHLFADLLRQRLYHEQPALVDELHVRASAWHERNGLEIEAFEHAVAANDVQRAERLIEGQGVPLQYRGAAEPVRKWLESLPTTVMNARPSLLVNYASALNLTAHPTEAEQELQAAEAALEGVDLDNQTKNIIGHIAAVRAMMAVGQHQLDTIISQSRCALEYLHLDNLPVRTIINWTLGYAYQLQGDRAAASHAYTEVLSTSEVSGDIVSALAATTGLGNIQETQNQLHLAAESYRRGMQLFGDPPQPIAVGTYLGLAGILYEWNDLDATEQYGQLSLQLGQQLENIDTPALSGVLLTRLKLAQGDEAEAAEVIAQAEHFVQQHNFMHRMPEIASAQVLVLLKQGNFEAATDLAKTHELPLSQARVHLARGEPASALAVLEPLRQQAEADGTENARLKIKALQAVALYERRKIEGAVQVLGEALTLAERGDMIRTFVDEGASMAQLLQEAASQGVMSDYLRKLLAAFEAEKLGDIVTPTQPLVEPLSPRELEVLQLLAEDLTNREICERLYLALDTVKGHNRNIFAKLGVKNRTQAVYKASSLGILPHQ
jgi:LuxR family maltose regulon positive regulatory protein